MAKVIELLIIGDGFAAAVALIHLLRQGVDCRSICILGQRSLGRGNAYDCNSPAFRLNVREDLPIVFSDDPYHFARWAKETIADPAANTSAGYFYRRSDFGQYIAHLVGTQLAGRTLDQIKGWANRINGNDGNWQVHIQSGEIIIAKKIILATGNAPPSWPCKVNPASHTQDLLIENPWSGDYVKNIQSNDRVVLLGAGLTALDAINALVEQNHRGPVYIISPRAIFPPVQAPWSRSAQPQWPAVITPTTLVRFMRGYLPNKPSSSTEWQSAWEELRPDLNRIWQGFTEQQRRVLMSHFAWLWNLYRFRASPQTIQAYAQLKKNQQIEFYCGRANQIEVCDEQVVVTLNNGKFVIGDFLINCTGASRDRLLDDLIHDGIARDDALKQAISVNAQFAVLDPQQKAHASLWMIGPATMGSLGDVVAASAIAKQAEQLAQQIHSNWIDQREKADVFNETR